MIIFVDFDGVIANFVKQYVKFYNNKYGENVDWTTIKRYWLPDSLPKLKVKDVYKCLDTQAFFGTMEPMPGAIDALNYLNEKHTIIIASTMVTARSFVNKTGWLTNHFPWFAVHKHLIAIHDKHLLDQYNSIIIDDSPAVITKFEKSLTVCLSWPHNEVVRGQVDLYARNWSEIISFIDRL